MALESITNINVDFYDKKYILINAKQYDKNSRFLSVTCYNHGKPFILSSAQHSAYVRYRKADEHGVFNVCKIEKGKIIVELTEQMLAVNGICYADIVIVNSGNAIVDADTGAIIGIDGSSILSTMTFCVDVSEAPIENSEIETTYEFNVLNETLDKYEANYQNVVRTAKSWAVGDTGIRDGEDVDNAKYYAELALKNAYGGDSIVTGIKCTNDSDYRNGQVTIDAYNVGAVPVGTAVLYTDVASVDEVKNALGIV